jgi:hypothetical protein
MDLSGPGIDVKLKERKKERCKQRGITCLTSVKCSKLEDREFMSYYPQPGYNHVRSYTYDLGIVPIRSQAGGCLTTKKRL